MEGSLRQQPAAGGAGGAGAGAGGGLKSLLLPLLHYSTAPLLHYSRRRPQVSALLPLLPHILHAVSVSDFGLGDTITIHNGIQVSTNSNCHTFEICYNIFLIFSICVH